MELMRDEVRERWHRGKYVIPNAVTLGNMFCGFLCIKYAAFGQFEKAAIAIGIAILLDGLDGRVARGLNATSKFGLEFDSFSDVISFGVAPAFLMYHWCFRPLADEFGVIVCFLFCLSAAIRLARFNITDASIKNFEGLPTPGAAGVVGALVNFKPTITPSFPFLGLGTVLTLYLSYLMVSRVEFFSIKRIKITNMNKFVILCLGVGIAVVWYDSGKGFLLLAMMYMLSGPLMYLRKKLAKNTWPKAA